MTIMVLGPGCMNCATLERRAREAAGQLRIQADVGKITDLNTISSFGVLRTPGLVIEDRLVWQGGVPTVEKIKELILAHAPAGS